MVLGRDARNNQCYPASCPDNNYIFFFPKMVRVINH